MSFWTTIKNFFTVAPKMTADVFDKDNGLLVKTGGFINDLHYSDQEKAKDRVTLIQNVFEFVKMSLGESTVRSNTRRMLAILWLKTQLSLILMTAICIPFNGAMADRFFDLATCNVMTWGTGSIIVFYFGAYVWGTYIKKKAE